MFQKAFGMLALAMCECIAPCVLSGQSAPPSQTITLPPGQTTITTQPTTPPTALTPAEVYKQSMRPLDQVRTSLDNWSDAELGALSIGISKARETCTQMNPQDYSGDDLYDYAHLCAFGQVWGAANTAAARYIASNAEPHRAQAYALSINALIQMNTDNQAISTAREMLDKLPYDAEVAFTLRYMKDTLEQRGNPEAFALAEEEHEKIITALKQGASLKATTGDAVITIGDLYDSAMLLAFYEQYMNNGIAGAAIAASCDNALPDSATLTPEDRQHIERVRTRFHLLEQQLPNLAITLSLASPTTRPRLPQSFGAGTVLVLFPDWCVQCRKMMKTLTEFAKLNADTPLHAYGLVFADTSMITDSATHEGFLQELQGTSTFIVPADTPQTLGAQEFPLAIAIDSAGVVRFVGAVPSTAFNGDGYITKVIQRMTASEPVKKTASTQTQNK
jgi:thiol-disulfide isomerase/thioredoxin